MQRISTDFHFIYFQQIKENKIVVTKKVPIKIGTFTLFQNSISIFS